MHNLKNRKATPDDAPDLVDIVLMAGEGLPDLVWSKMANEGETARQVGLRRAAGEDGSFSYRNATLFGDQERTLGGLVGYLLPDVPVEIGEDFPPAFIPLQELENLASGHWYVNILGVRPEARGQGIGTAMLTRAEELAGGAGASGMAIIVFSSNPRAERLYRRTGYEETARRRMHVPGWKQDGCEAILLVKKL